MKAGVLALQGDFREHARMLAESGATPMEVRTPSQLADDFSARSRKIGGIVETITSIAEQTNLLALNAAIEAARVAGGEPLFGLMDIGVERNAYGRQVESFEADLDVIGIDHPVRGVFIRAPRITDVGAEVRVLSSHEGAPVVLEQENLLVASFHPELIDETGLHRYLLTKI